MSDKPKRKYHYRRLWAFRGLLIALIVFLGAIGYLLTRPPEAEYIIYQLRYSYTDANSGALMRADVNTGTSDYLMPEFDLDSSATREIGKFVVSGDGQTIIYTDYKPDFGIRVYTYDIPTSQRKLLFDCVQWSGNCYLEDLNSDGSKLIFHVETTETIWYEIDVKNGEMQILAQSEYKCILSGNIHQLLIVTKVCDFGVKGYQILNYETEEIVMLEGASNLLFNNNATHYAYTISLGDADVDRNGDTLPRDVFVGQWGNKASIRLLAGHVADVLEDWHPDNKRLLVSRHTVEYDADGGYEFVLYDTETGEATSLLYLRGARLSQAQWNADGTKFAYVVNPMYGFDISSTIVWVYDLSSGETTLIGYDGRFPQWAN
jgi:Tol biopolymer transport system component